MASRSASPALPAKLTRPRSDAVLTRSRVNGLLDLAAKHPVTWLCGAPGAGKTTAVSTYLEARQVPHLWYQIDAGDADPATFFHYLGLAVRAAAPRYRSPLPSFSPEQMPGIEVFARRFFETLFGRLKPSTILVLDDYQEAGLETALHAVVAQAVLALPDAVRLLVLSRAEPPLRFARFRANGTLDVLGGAELNLSMKEAQLFAQLRGKRHIAQAVLATLHERTQGWTAGMVLLLESAQRPTHHEVPTDATPEVLFDYFAAEVFGRLDLAAQAVLTHAALLPEADVELVVQLTGDAQAGRVLEELYRRNYFVSKRGSSAVYRFHPLFHDFLRQRGQANLGTARLNALRSQAATLLAATGDIEGAAELWRAAGDWPQLMTHLLKHAPTLVRQARFQTLGGWLRELPEQEFERAPWLCYWLGVCRMHSAPAQACTHFESAFSRFELSGDADGLYLSWAGAVDTIVFMQQDYFPIDAWLVRLDWLTRTYPEFSSVEIETRIVSTALIAITWRQPKHAAAARLQQRSLELLWLCPDPAATVMLAFHAFMYCYWFDSDAVTADCILERLPMLDKALAQRPFERILIRFIQANHHASACQRELTFAAVNDGMALAERSGVHVLDRLLTYMGFLVAHSTGDTEMSSEFVRRTAEVALRESTELDVAMQAHMRAHIAELRGEHAQALQEMTRAHHLFREMGFMPMSLDCAAGLAVLRLCGGDLTGARSAAAQAHTAPGFSQGAGTAFNACVAAGLIALAQGDEPGARAAADSLMKLVRRSGYATGPGAIPEPLARLCAFALQHQIEAGTARHLIERRSLRAPPDLLNPDCWHWPIKLYALGRFSIALNDRPMASSGKQAHRPLEVLKLLIASGPRGLTHEQIVRALWATENAESGYPPYAMAMHRVRKMLGVEQCILSRNGRVALNPGVVWVDAWAFERAVESIDVANTDHELPQSALELYQGSFLGAGPLPEWAQAFAQRLHAKYVRVVLELVHAARRQGELERALHLCEQALERDDCQEPLYEALLACHLALGRRVDGLRAYKRCRKRLQDELEIVPSAAIEALRVRLQQAA
jgi:LuxR family transcriptional regulator, maltose regulon positive regulatory protein